MDSLRSVGASGAHAVYVDSGSRDGSVDRARELGFPVVCLDPGRPFSAARARNEGFAAILAEHPDLDCVQFVDGDCELEGSWIDRCLGLLSERSDVAAACGTVRERSPESSVYNRLCSLEWQQPAGEVKACGGNMMVRASSFRAVGGFREGVIAAEDDELCLRLRRAGGRIVRLDAPMVVHETGMTRFRQWWQRARRSGFAYAQGSALHGSGQDRHFVRENRRILFWGLALPVTSMVAAIATGGAGLALLLAYPLQVARLYRQGRRRGWSPSDASLYARFIVLANFPELVGLLEFHLRRGLGKPAAIIEHKGPEERP